MKGYSLTNFNVEKDAPSCKVTAVFLGFDPILKMQQQYLLKLSLNLETQKMSSDNDVTAIQTLHIIPVK